MNLYRGAICALGLVLLAGTGPTRADHAAFDGRFDGAEPVLGALPGQCNGAGSLGYRVAEPFQVSASGNYEISDVGQQVQVDVVMALYQGSFDPAAPAQNLVAGIDEGGLLALQAGVDYVLVVQEWCFHQVGRWGVSLRGPGTISGADVVTQRAATFGTFDGSEPRADTLCGNTYYEVSGPVVFSETGEYTYVDASLLTGFDMSLAVYSAPFDPQNPAANLVAADDDTATFTLNAGQSYYFVAQPLCADATGDWRFVLFGPVAMRFNAALAGSWFNPDTPGQGFFIDVFPELEFVFMAWFTFELALPGGNAMLGNTEQRWLTMFGNFDGDTAQLQVENTGGGVFNSGTPAVTQDTDYGSLTLSFQDCEQGNVQFNFPKAGVNGTVPIQRLVGDNVPLCEQLVGTVGPIVGE